MLISYRRHAKEEGVTYINDGDIDPHRWHYDDCPMCGEPVTWIQYCAVWTEDDSGDMQPDWDSSESWNAVCHKCQYHFVDPYEDGLIRAFECSEYFEDDKDDSQDKGE